MRVAWAFFLRDATVALSYRASFALQLLGNLILLGIFYYVGKTVAGGQVPAVAVYGGDYLAFLLVGIALTDCVGVSLTTFAMQMREGQLSGALEATLMSPVPLPLVIVYSSLWNYFFSAMRFLLYLFVGAFLYDVSLVRADVPAAIVIFLLTVVSFAGIGIAWAGFVMLVKRGDAIMTTVGYLVLLLSGVVFPNTVLPPWLQRVALFVPLTHSLDGMRHALLQGQGLVELSGTVGTLCVFGVVLLGGGMLAFSHAVRVAKQTGSLTEH